MKSIVVALSIALTNGLEIELETTTEAIPPWDFNALNFYESTYENCDRLIPPLDQYATGYGGYIYHTPACLCIWDADDRVVNWCAMYNLVPNPLYEGETPSLSTLCVTPA